VVRAVNRETGAKVAVKVLADHAQSRREVECQRRGKEGVVRILDVFFDESASDWKVRLGGLPPLTVGRVIVVVMELMEGGELFYRVVNSQGKRLCEDDTRVVAVQLAEALAQLHDAGVVHRDVKPENILLRSADSLDLKLCDFGFASFDRVEGIECTVVYAAPEMIQKIVSGAAGHAGPAVTSAFDCWSLGVVLYLCLGGRYPFKAKGNEISPEFKRANLRGLVPMSTPAWDNVSNAAKSVVLGLLTVDPDKRMSAREVLAHPWLRDLAAERARVRAAVAPPSSDTSPTVTPTSSPRSSPPERAVSPVPRIGEWPDEGAASSADEEDAREDSGRPDSRDDSRDPTMHTRDTVSSASAGSGGTDVDVDLDTAGGSHVL
jgi:serine/threonine protein kinase